MAGLGCALVLGSALGLSWTARSALARRGVADSDVYYRVLPTRMSRWATHSDRGDALTGVVFGDSVFAQPPKSPVFVPTLDAALRADGLPAVVLDLALGGLTPYQCYYVLNRVLALRPRFAIVELNLHAFTPDWPMLGAADLSADLSPRQVLRTHRALAAQSIGLLTPFVYRIEEATGMRFVLNGLRLITEGALEGLGAWVNTTLGLPQQSSAERSKALSSLPTSLDLPSARPWYREDFVASPVTEMLRATVGELEAAGVLTLVVVAPVNTARLEKLGLVVEDLALGSRLERLRVAIGVRPDQWVETSHLFKPGDFVDAAHVRPEGVERIAKLVGAHLAERLRSDGGT